MWLIIKVENNNINFFLKNLSLKLNSEIKSYVPKAQIQYYKKNKLTNKIVNILGDYIFINHKSFSDINFLNYIKNIKGLKYFLSGCKNSQTEIKEFINKCKSLEGKKGLLNYDLYNLDLEKNYRFSNGPLVGKLFKIINYNKNKLNVLIGNFKTTLNRKSFFLEPV